ncbi:hypothetical protein Dimus_037607, partial [Dionaea muscipula]
MRKKKNQDKYIGNSPQCSVLAVLSPPSVTSTAIVLDFCYCRRLRRRCSIISVTEKLTSQLFVWPSSTLRAWLHSNRSRAHPLPSQSVVVAALTHRQHPTASAQAWMTAQALASKGCFSSEN